MRTKHLFSIAALAIMMAACSTDEDIQVKKQQGIPFTATIEADNGAVTRSLMEGTDRMQAYWQITETMALVYTAGGQQQIAKATVTSVNQETGAATISATLNEGVTNGTKLDIIYPYEAVDLSTGGIRTDLLAEQDGMLGNKADNTFLDVRKGTGIVSILGGKAVMGSSTKLAAQYAIFGFTLGTPITANYPLLIKKGNDVVTTVTPTAQTSRVYVAMAPASGVKYKFEVVNPINKIYKEGTANISAGKYYQKELPARYPLDMSKVDENVDIGSIIANDGKVYLTPQRAQMAGVTPEAMIAFIGQVECNHGLALALSECNASWRNLGGGTYYWTQAGDFENNAAPIPHWRANHPIAGAEWRLPSNQDWQLMFLGCRVENDAIARASVMGPIYGFHQKLEAVGASLSSYYEMVYWTSTGEKTHVIFEYDGSRAEFTEGGWYGDLPLYVRAVLSF